VSLALPKQGGRDTVVGIDLRTGEERYSFPRPTTQQGYYGKLAVSPDGTLLASSYDNDFRVYDLSSRTLLITGRPQHSTGIQYLEFSPSSSHIATGSYDGTVSIWERPFVWEANVEAKRETALQDLVLPASREGH